MDIVTSLGLFWKLAFIGTTILWARAVNRSAWDRAGEFAGLLTGWGLLGTVYGIGQALMNVGETVDQSMIDTFIHSVGISIGTTLVGIALYIVCTKLATLLREGEDRNGDK